MAIITGIVVEATVARRAEAGTDDRLYVGLHGSGGGELSLNTPQDDWEPGEPVRIILGEPRSGNFSAFHQAHKSEPGGMNDPARWAMNTDSLDNVSFRKSGPWNLNDDDLLELEDARVSVRAHDGSSQDLVIIDFSLLTIPNSPNIFLGNEVGLQKYLKRLVRGVTATERPTLGSI